jgi:protein SCO1/2
MRFFPKSSVYFLLGALALSAGCATPHSAVGDSANGRQISDPDATNLQAGSVCSENALWETDTGKTIKLSDLNGRVRVISMFYSTCQGVCAITKADMQAIEASLSPAARERVGFVLVTLDPENDTAEALQTYRRDASLSPARWTLARGNKAATGRLAKLLGIGAGRDDSGRYIHTSELIVLDQSGRIIHHYSGLRADLQAITSEIEAVALHKT